MTPFFQIRVLATLSHWGMELGFRESEAGELQPRLAFHPPPASGVPPFRGALASPQSFFPCANVKNSAIGGSLEQGERLEEDSPWHIRVVLFPLPTF